MLRTITCTLCLTRDCTLRCRYCYAGRKYAHSMSKETAKRAIDIVFEEACRTRKAADISFFGGEPLMEWELLQWCILYAEGHSAPLPARPRFSITTNGTLLTSEKIDWLAAHDVLIGLSIDGSPTMHNINRRHPNGGGSHVEVATALALIAVHPTLKSQLVCVVTPNNVEHLSKGIEWLSQHYHGNIGLNLDYWNQWSEADFAILCDQYKKVAAMVEQSYLKGEPIHLRNLEDKILTHLHPGKDTLRCLTGEREIAVTADGTFFPCSRLIGDADNPEHNLGNVHEGINRAKQLAHIQARGCRTTSCSRCELRYRCLNSCACTNYAASGNINEVSPFLCCSEKLFIHTADELAERLYSLRNPAFMSQFYPSLQ